MKSEEDRKSAMRALKLEGYSYAEVGRAYGVSGQRVQQILKPPQSSIRSVLERRVCFGCGQPIDGSGQVHHAGTDLDTYDDPESLRLFCVSCHVKYHWAERRIYVEPKPPRPPTTYPTPVEVDIPRLTCARCNHQWSPRVSEVYQCPACKSPRWNEPKESSKGN